MAEGSGEAKKTVSVAYTLFLIGLAIQAAMIAGVLVAHAKKAEVAEADPALAGHLTQLIVTFWMAAPIIAAAAIAVFEMGIEGAAWLFVVWIWVIWRVVRGAVRFWKGREA